MGHEITILSFFLKPTRPGGTLVLIGLGLAAPACAQQAPGGVNEPTDIAGTRAQPLYDPVGIRLGEFTALPSVEGGFQYESNIFGRTVDSVGDGSGIVVPAIEIDQNRGQDPLTLSARAQFRKYFDYPRQDDNQVWLTARKTLSITARDKVMANLDWSDTTVSRGTFLNTLQVGGQLKLESLHGTMTYEHVGGRVILDLTGHLSDDHYNPVQLDDGQIEDQSFRNQRTYEGSARLTYDIGGNFSADGFVDYAHNDFSDPSPLTNRNANALTVMGGTKYQLTGIVYIQAEAGIINYDFDNPAYHNFRGLALHVALHWFPTPLLTVRLDTKQVTTTGSFSGVDAVAVTSPHLQAVYEVKRNFNIEANAEYQYQNYFDLKEKAYAIDLNLAAVWKIDHHVSVRASAGYRRQTAAQLAEVPRNNDVITGISLIFAK